MKLYPKLALTILILILLQASFTGILVSRTIRNNNLEDALVELRLKADFIVNNYQSWKRHLWKQLIQVLEYSKEMDEENLKSGELKSLLTSSNIDAVIIKTEDGNYSMTALNTSPDFILPPVEDLSVVYNHPSISLYQMKGQFYMIGIINLSSLSGNTEIYLVKHINDSFLNNIIFDKDGRILFHTSTDFLAGHKEIQTIAFHQSGTLPGMAYKEWYDLEEEDQSYNMASTKVGEISSSSGNTSSVYLTTILSNEPYQRRILSIERTVLTVSLFTLLFTFLLILIFTRGITRPVALLANAMGHIREGSYNVQLKIADKGEMGVLLKGFNGMAARLHQDQIKIEKSLDEITFLNEFNEEVIHSIRDALAVVNDDMIIEKANPAFDILTELKVRTLTGFINENFDTTLLEGVRKVLFQGEERWTQRIRNRQDQVFEVKIYPVHRESHMHSEKRMCVLILEDISEKNAYEEKIFQAEKLSSISMLSAGIAHEVNNPLSSILTNIQNLIYEEADTERLKSLHLVEEESIRIAQIIRDLTNFTSRELGQGNICSPLIVAEEVVRLIRHSRRPDGTRIPPVSILCDPAVADVIISKGELMQVLINLLQNAAHATENDKPIKISIREENQRAIMTIEDQGKGIPEEILNRVFDPFFTTKANNEGTGLGLSVVYGIIMKYKGTIKIESKKGTGTVIVFSLPTISKQEAV
ncbi:HAMP domain-containing sensor histidine kinase [Oceanispirochaeta sp.]|jgi:signal transduction histidine kinase|uniref:sensor histidine kinase n=1 Tax=Oceanispirochaeta sp. TaxID=2035350 RepID=UPI0026018BB1|nr:HAMP domain-containing sensor histidine kinase [Oceanispirochaeta sp.]MDA3958607.1 ATP-binding protein [Oceanispirochaeta sp.]